MMSPGEQATVQMSEQMGQMMQMQMQCMQCMQQMMAEAMQTWKKICPKFLTSLPLPVFMCCLMR